MPRRSTSVEDVSDSLGGDAPRRPRRNTKPVDYAQDDAKDDHEDDAVMAQAGGEVDVDDDEEAEFREDNAAAEEDESLEAEDSEEEDEAPVATTARRTQRKTSNNSKRKSNRETKEPARKSARSNKYTSSMADSADNSDLFWEEEETNPSSRKKTSRKRSHNNTDDEEGREEDHDDDESEAEEDKGTKKANLTKPKANSRRVPATPQKSPARRHKERRRTIQEDDGYSSEQDEKESGEEDYASDESEGEEVDPLKIQRIIATRTELKSKWKEICSKLYTSEITNGSRWFQTKSATENGEHDSTAAAAAGAEDDTYEERFLVKWADLSFLHSSWETRSDLIEQTEGAKAYLSTFFKKSQDGFLFDADERNDGDYFDPAFTQIDRILEVKWPDGVKPTGHDKEADLTPQDVGIKLDDCEDESCTGRQFLIKWGNQSYSDATYEFERDLIWNDVDYKAHVEAFLKRNNKPPKRVRNQAMSAGKQELSRVLKIFGTQDAIDGFQKEVQDLEFKNGGKLRDYQAEGVTWMLSNYCQKRSSILADEMGLGKTLQIVVTTMMISRMSPVGVFLVVAPLSTLEHWKREFEAWTDLNTIIYHGSAKDRDHIRRHEIAFECDRPARVAFNSLYLKKCGPKKFDRAETPWMVQVIITTPEMLVANDASELMAIKYDMLVVDEAHRMKNRNSKLTAVLHDHRFTFNHRVLLTGTPIQNNVAEFWTLLNFCDERNYDDVDEFLEKYGDMKDKERVDELHEEIRPYILRRLKEDVEKSVPPKEETIIEVELTLPQKQYYRALYERNVKFLYKNKSKALDGPSLNNLAMQLRKCCNHVCLLNGVEDELRRDSADLDEADFLVKGSGKLVLLDKLLPRLREEGHRVLLFSQFKIMLDLIEDYLISRGMKMERIDGSITGQKRQQAIDRFQSREGPNGSEPPFIMLLSTRAGGQGITLTAADTCIIFDSDWNPQNDLQAQARCHRIGQTSEVKVYRLISAKSYEKQMFHLSSLKMGLDQAVLKGFEKGGANDSGMSKEEVERLLKHGAYDILNEEKAGTAEAASNEFMQQDIDSILAGRSRTVVHENTGSQSEAAGGTFSKASFKMTQTPGKEKNNADVDDPNFWAKILGEEHLKESTEDLASKKRQRNQTNYNEAAYQQQLEAAIAGDNPSDGNSDDESDDEEDYAANTHRVNWAKSNENDWNLSEAESLSEHLLSFGYGNFEWAAVHDRLGLKDLSRDEVKRMAFSMVLYCIIEATESEISASTKREEKLAEKPAENGGRETGLSPGEIRQAAFKKFWDSSAEWIGKLVVDIVVYAKDNTPRDHDTLMELLHHRDAETVEQEDVRALFAKNVWAPLRSRGWKATGLDGSSSELVYSYADEKYRTVEEVLEVARERYTELTGVIESVSNAVAKSKARSKEAQFEKRQKIEALSPLSASLELIKSVVHLYGSAQLIADRKKTHPKIRLTRRVLASCSLMSVAFDYVKKAETLVEGDSTIEKISKCIQIDKRTSIPHPKWTTYHDAVLVHAITQHGWLDSESSCQALKQDDSMAWGLPFDRSRRVSKPVEETLMAPAPMVEGVAERACKFLNSNKKLLNASKAFHQSALLRIYWLEKRPTSGQGDSLANPMPPEENFVINREALSQEEGIETAELADLPTRKEMLKRAKMLFTRGTISVGTSTDESQPKPDHGLTVLDQSNSCNVFLAQLVKGMMKAPAGGELYKLLWKASVEEVNARLRDLDMHCDAEDSRIVDKLQQQKNDLRKILEQIDTAKRQMHKSVRLGKNILRAIIGEELVASKNPNEPLLPIMTTRLKVTPTGRKQATLQKSVKGTSKKVDTRMAPADAAILEARKIMSGSKRKPDSTVDLTEVETLIMQTASSFGIPRFCLDWREEYPSSSTPSGLVRFIWSDFGRRLVETATSRMDEVTIRRDKANKQYDTLEVTPNVSVDKRNSIERATYLADLAYESCETAKGQAEDYACEPETLAKKTVMTLSKTSLHARSMVSSEGASSLTAWLSIEIAAWGKELELLGDDGMVLALTAQDFLEELNEAERSCVQAVAAFDASLCSRMVSQVALISRLGAFLRSNRGESDSLQAYATQAAMDKAFWANRPTWWSKESADFDILLLKRLCEFGTVGLVTAKSNYGLVGSQAKAMYKSSGIHRLHLIERAKMLMTEIHNLESSGNGERNDPPGIVAIVDMTLSDEKVPAIVTDPNHDTTPPASKKARVSVS